MGTIEKQAEVDPKKLEQFVFGAVEEVGATLNAALVVMGDKLVLGAQAGEAKIAEVVSAGGFGRFRRAAETPFNLVFEARP